MNKVVQAFADFTRQEQEVWKPLLNYLGISPDQLATSQRAAKRMSALAGKLARYFLNYGVFGGKIIEKWNNTIAIDWQQALWIRMEDLYKMWNYPYRKFETFTVEHFPPAAELQVHLFGLSYLAPVHHRFLMKISEHLPVKYYLISPCQKFWTDLLSDKEGVRLKAYWQKRGIGQGQQQDLDGYLRDNNPLLANFGKLGREMTRQIEETPVVTIEKYALPVTITGCEGYSDLLDDELLLYESSHFFTLLEAVQSDIVLLRNPEESDPIDFSEYDGSIQVHIAPKPMREVEAIYNAILGILDKHRLDEFPLLSRDVIVMAPNIAEYAPFIRSVFGAPNSAVDYQIMDLEMPAQNSFVQAFLHLLQLPLCRWDAASLLRLFEYEAFQERQRLSWEDVQVLRKWIKMAGIRWGRDYLHRNQLLERDHCSKEMFEGSGDGTWDYGLGRLLEGLAMFSGKNQAVITESIYLPIERIEATQSELLGRIIHLLRSLLEDLRPLSDGTKLTAKEWSLYLKCLCDTYFSVNVAEDDHTGYQELIQQIDAFEKVLPQIEDAVFDFHSIQLQLEQALNKKTVNHRESHLQAIRFCSLLPMRSIPGKIIVLMGMNDGAFPRADEEAKLNCLLHNSDADYFPSQVDFDRYLFLEAILSARRYFLLSYISQVKGDTKKQSPSLLITELLGYLDKNYRLPSGLISQSCTVHHALMPFDKRYFTMGFTQRSYVKAHFAAAQSHYKSDKQNQHQFISAFTGSNLPMDGNPNDVIVDLSELTAFARNPLKTYFNKSLGIYLEKEEDRALPCNEEWQLSHLNTAMISREALFSSVPQTLMRAEKVGRLPSGPFREIGAEKIRKEVESLTSNLHMHGVSTGDVFALEFSDRFLSPMCQGLCWEMPALNLVTPLGVHVKLIGRLERVALQGLVYFGEDVVKDAVKAWPSLLALCS
ncbi:MAG: exodeoxyribonuclease V subunit gamma, partial [Parachlamydiaceae bacterium]|nr:exodeoxyribonuclease V subunit gamma [Parachlamydiaceae bacterium]